MSDLIPKYLRQMGYLISILFAGLIIAGLIKGEFDLSIYIKPSIMLILGLIMIYIFRK